MRNKLLYILLALSATFCSTLHAVETPFMASPTDTTQLSPLYGGTEGGLSDTTQLSPSTGESEGAETKTGWNFGGIPFASYDNDLSLQLGALANIYYYGDGAIYPNYYHGFYVEASYYLRHSGIFTFNYNSNYLIPNHGFKVDLSYLPDAMCDFYGYNGYQSIYHDDWRVNTDSTTRLFYKYKRNILRFMTDIDGEIYKKLRWSAGLGLYWFDVAERPNLKVINSTQAKDNQYPDLPGLVEKYAAWNLIDQNALHGGVHPYVRAGLVFDSRDYVANPNKGIYADAFLTYSAAFGQQKQYNNLVLNFNFRQYFTLYPRYLTMAYRIGGQNVIAGEVPFYANSIMNVLYQQRTMYEALGGGSSIRGMLRGRVQAKGFLFANVELRAVFTRFDIGKQHFYVGATPFFDIGMITDPYDLPTDLQARMDATGDKVEDYFLLDKKAIYTPHMSAGIGLKIAMNENFIISADWAVPFSTQDNASQWDNFYINIGYLF